MPAPLMHIESSPSLPREADVVVIGGGVVGVFTAYYLARRGVSVALLEKGRVAAEQSSRNWGWCRQQNRDARELPMATKSLDLWEKVAQETGEDTGFRRCGLLYLSQDENELAGWAKWRDFARTRRCYDAYAERGGSDRTWHSRPAANGKAACSRRLTVLPILPGRCRLPRGASWQPAEPCISIAPRGAWS